MFLLPGASLQPSPCLAASGVTGLNGHIQEAAGFNTALSVPGVASFTSAANFNRTASFFSEVGCTKAARFNNHNQDYKLVLRSKYINFFTKEGMGFIFFGSQGT